MMSVRDIARGCATACLAVILLMHVDSAWAQVTNPPVITSLSPTSAWAGEMVTLSGSGFGATQGSSYVKLVDVGTNWGAPNDGASWTIDSWSNTQIVFTVPSPSGPSGEWKVVPNTTATVTVSVGGVTSNAENLAITQGAVITSVSPASAWAGEMVTLSGSGFGATQGSSYVKLVDVGINWGAPNDGASWTIDSWSNTQIVFTVPTPSGPSGEWAVVPNTTATITVSVGGGTSNAENLAITQGAAITSVSPSSAWAGEMVTLNGSGFGATQGSSYVKFMDVATNWGAPGDGASWTIDSWSNTQIVFTVPTPSGPSGEWKVVPNTTATVTVSVGGGTSNAENIAITQSTPPAQATNIYTRDFDLARTGANLNETTLTPANVNPTQFGKLFTVNTDGEIYAQPLYVSNLMIAGTAHDVVFVATMNNSIYAIDAGTGAILWINNFGTPIVAAEVQNDDNIADISGVGILSTPVIDPTTNRMYFVHGTEPAPSTHEYQLEVIDITTGNRVLSPVTVSGSYTVAGLNSPVVFNPTMQNQRSSLALANGNVYFAFSSHEDQIPYQGWVFGYSASTLAQIGVYSDEVTGDQGGIWMSGSAPPVDSQGNLYLSSGNGSFGLAADGINVMQTGSSFIKLSSNLQLLDYFTPSDSAALSANDMDLGSGGVLLIPNPTNPQKSSKFVLGGGKQGVLYLADPNNLGKFNASEDQVIQEFQAIYGTGSSHIHGTPIYFNSATNGPSTYVWGENDYLRGFQFNAAGGLLTTTPFAESTMTAPATYASGAMPGGFLSISANGGTNGIVWASTPYAANAVHAVVQGVLYAFSADTLKLLWSDKDNDARDEIGLFAKFCPPIVADGRLYVPTFGPVATGKTIASGQLVVYGLLP